MNEKALIADAIWELDPAGIAAIRSDAPDEYDELVSGLSHLLRAGANQARLTQWVEHFFGSVWGVEVPSSLIQELVASVLRIGRPETDSPE